MSLFLWAVLKQEYFCGAGERRRHSEKGKRSGSNPAMSRLLSCFQNETEAELLKHPQLGNAANITRPSYPKLYTCDTKGAMRVKSMSILSSDDARLCIDKDGCQYCETVIESSYS